MIAEKQRSCGRCRRRTPRVVAVVAAGVGKRSGRSRAKKLASGKQPDATCVSSHRRQLLFFVIFDDRRNDGRDADGDGGGGSGGDGGDSDDRRVT